MRLKRWQQITLIVGTALVMLPVLGHFWVRWSARLTPPTLNLPAPEELETVANGRRVGKASAVRRDGIWEVHLEGSPAEIGQQHALLLRSSMVENEGVLFRHFETAISNPLLRLALLDLAQLRFRAVHRSMSSARITEIAAQAESFAPDPYTEIFPTFQRFVYLNALYDISLSFEHSPLIGCTSFTFSPHADSRQEPLLARAFDFEVDPIFDRDKAVFFVKEQGKIPFASVAWPGLVGVVSGMNLEGLSVVVHGGRAGETLAHGEPVVHALRRVLAEARTTKEAIALLQEPTPMVSHIVIVQDRDGDSAALERVPRRPLFVRRLPKQAAVTNHFEGPEHADPKNQRVRDTTSTLARRQRADELLRRTPTLVKEADAVAFLRDRKGANGTHLELGDRRAIDALIATHGVVMNSAQRSLWVSTSPHLLGKFVRFSLSEAFSEHYQPGVAVARESIAEDPLLHDARYRHRLKSQPARPHAAGQ